MSTLFVLYLPGRAGNFLARLFSLGTDTMPQLPQTLLTKLVHDPVPDTIDRLDLYRFSTVPTQYKDWQQFHRSWSDYYQDAEYRLLRLLWNQAQRHLVYAIHPYEFIKFQDRIDREPNKKFLAVDLDHRYDAWIEHSRRRLGFRFRPDEHDQYCQLADQYSMYRLDLGRMLENQQAFLEEYLSACDWIALLPCIEQALTLYQDWKAVRT